MNMSNYLYMYVKKNHRWLFPMYTANEINYVTTNVCTGEILLLYYMCNNITYATFIYQVYG